MPALKKQHREEVGANKPGLEVRNQLLRGRNEKIKALEAEKFPPQNYLKITQLRPWTRKTKENISGMAHVANWTHCGSSGVI